MACQKSRLTPAVAQRSAAVLHAARATGWLLPLVVVLGAGSAAVAAPKTSPLEGAPAVRHRYQLRDSRFEIGPSVSFSLNRSLRHAILVGARLAYHVTDYLAVGGDVAGGFSIDTGLAGEIEDNYVARDQKALWDTRRQHFSDITLAGNAGLYLSPLAGKIGIFSKLFFFYDLYVMAGFGFAMTKNKTESTGETKYDEANEGFRPGFAWGVGMRFYFTRWMSMAIELKDLLFSDNESGEDLTRGTSSNETPDTIVIDKDDRTLTNHFFGGLVFSFYLPFTPKVSD